jgi:hypothetical protein
VSGRVDHTAAHGSWWRPKRAHTAHGARQAHGRHAHAHHRRVNQRQQPEDRLGTQSRGRSPLQGSQCCSGAGASPARGISCRSYVGQQASLTAAGDACVHNDTSCGEVRPTQHRAWAACSSNQCAALAAALHLAPSSIPRSGAVRQIVSKVRGTRSRPLQSGSRVGRQACEHSRCQHAASRP